MNDSCRQKSIWSLILLLTIVSIGFFILFTTALAQSLAGETSVAIVSNPRLPEPNQTVELTLNAYTIDTTGGTIKWFVDGVELIEEVNTRMIEITAPEPGSTVLISAEITTRSGQRIPVRYELEPKRLDLIIEAKTLTPSFYKGRALPSTDSTVRAVALPQIANTDPQDYSYIWRLNSKVLFGGSIKGKHTAEFQMPMGRDAIIAVDVIDQTGQVVAADSSVIPSVTPELYFYPDNPLRGVSRIALPSIYNLVGPEVDVRAEPYFMDEEIFTTSPLLEWSINGSVVDNPNDDQQTITLQNGGGLGNFKIDFHIRNLRQLLQGIEDGFTLRF